MRVKGWEWWESRGCGGLEWGLGVKGWAGRVPTQPSHPTTHTPQHPYP